MRKALLVFVDGLGIRNPANPLNPIQPGSYPVLSRILYNEAIPIDPVMGVPGIPQSATGQTSLLCGVNAQQAIGRHKEGFPGKLLKDIIKNDNIFKNLKIINKEATFANGYWRTDISDLSPKEKRMVSVTTAASLFGLGQVRLMEKLRNKEAVYQDLTQEILVQRGASMPVITVKEAADRLYRIFLDHDFTLFEYFQTDIAGHKQEPTRIAKVLADVNGFLSRLHEIMDFRKETLILTSDHGNIEDMSTPSHTLNPVPFYVKGPGSAALIKRVRDLAGITPAILALFAER
jgi:2,3-bisphosphoglycerate-independent phosphoglycerate mutase